MTVRVERTFELSLPLETVWEFIADPAKRASAISVVDDYESDGERGVWHVRLPLLGRTIDVETRDVERDPPRYVKFVGESSVFQVTGEHELEATDEGCRLTNRFVVDGRLPGVETFFEQRLDEELTNIERAIREREQEGT
ncbi:SRPBCC family protein [Halospeciosus flavus]|uniref:SRPBCC family protein n=1 Tax=Halospeciosus flavus TaxID=3032283 RepID=A0ABD5Z3R7_9EURY|nr:SRPBCC family protein [Halospeciosus flavus]